MICPGSYIEPGEAKIWANSYFLSHSQTNWTVREPKWRSHGTCTMAFLFLHPLLPSSDRTSMSKLRGREEILVKRKGTHKDFRACGNMGAEVKDE